MALLTILEYPDTRLRTVAKPVTSVTENTRQLVADMLETMYDAPGVGLAATQVNVHQRIIVIDVSETKDEPVVLINPTITPHGEIAEAQEGCLSVPSFYEAVSRPSHVTVRAMDEHGQEREFEADGLLSQCIQHECDHLEGKLFVDYLTNLKRQRIRKKLEKQQRQKS